MKTYQAKVQGALAAGFAKKLAGRVSPKPLISFTFDDFPKSAWTAGGGILMKRGKRGTYYGCMGLMGGASEVGPLFTREDAHELHSAGHELGCHTLNHTSCFGVSAREFAESCEQNRRRATSVLDGYSMRNMSFPFGHVSLAAKRLVRSSYDTCRSTQPGTNIDPVDLNLLRANPIYSRFDIQRLKQLIRDNARANGWLILYTHDVAEGPSPYGCTPGYFEEVFDSALESGADVVTIRDALAHFRDTAVV
jgi:Polysaccharide deacetylase